ncbi:aldehyde dehydrogenase family protein [Candidatus Syntrophocurvum alkaliphilum]|nr:aldehyde dehydrogenase family protein [Candidatus Syntrophocurvum alkaliphilum]
MDGKNVETTNVPKEFMLENTIVSKINHGLNYLLDGQVYKWEGKTQKITSPIVLKEGLQTKQIELGERPLLTEFEAISALNSANKAYQLGIGEWATMPVEKRIEYMEYFLSLIKKKEKNFAIIEMWEIAKSYQDCQDEFKRTVKYIENTINTLRMIHDDTSDIKTIYGFIAQIRRCPLGTTLCMGPFNYPLNETFAMLIPALIMGNTAIVKPPDYGSLCTLTLLEDFAKAFPPGVINIINGNGEEIISPIIKSGKIDVLGFIGSTKVANLLIKQHPYPNRLRTILGLEAKNSAFILSDADLDLAVEECLKGALEFNGQRCTSIKHLWVHNNIKEKFLTKLCDELDKIKCGMPWEKDVLITPLPEAGKIDYLKGLVEDAIEKGGKVVNKGGGNNIGNIFYPAVVYPVTKEMQLYHVEQFGPIIPISSFSDINEIVEYLIESDYGQQASIFTKSTDFAAPLIDILVNQVSRINLNAQCRRGPDELPFTGRKNSGEGTLSVSDALRCFSIRSLVVANEQGKELFCNVLASDKSEFLRF